MIYHGRALAGFNASRLVAMLAGGAALAVLFWLYMLALTCGLAGGN